MIDQRITYIISDINKAVAFEWIAAGLKDKFSLSFILLNDGDTELETFLLQHDLPVTRVTMNIRASIFYGVFKVFSILRTTKPSVIHCHLFHATLIGLAAGWMSGIKKRIYTRHHSTYNHEYNKKGIWVDKLINWLSTDIVAISENVKKVLVEKEQVEPEKIHLIHHGFDLQCFEQVDSSRIGRITKQNKVRGKPVIGVIARWIEWKGIQYIIPAFSKLLQYFPSAHLVLANAKGPYKVELENQLSGLPDGSYTVIAFEHDLFALYQLFDVYVHTPINENIEAFGQTFVEALAAGVPSVFTQSGVATEFVEHKKNGLVVPYKDSQAIYESIKQLLSNTKLRSSIAMKGKESVGKFALVNMIHQLENIYSISQK